MSGVTAVAEILTLPGVTLPDAEDAEPDKIIEYFRKLVDLMERHEVEADGAVLILLQGNALHVQRVGIDSIRTMGVLGFAQRLVT